ncbi:THUMP-like domain-containing protein [Ekhidna sp.]|uniref:THUMP-like domain-containing protein n=1 Tax=Ekhidna sp. TaxID=2608089 RepID=UPI003C7D8AE8
MTSRIDFLTQPEVKEFIRENVNVDPNKLILNPPAAFRANIKEIAGQILSRQKAKGKLDSWASNFDIIMPPPLSIEQASSEATSHYKGKLLTGDHLIDLTGGMGIDCLSLSESFKRTTYLERDSDLCEVFSHNLKALNRKIEVINSNANDYLEAHSFDKNKTMVYMDPARRDPNKNRVFRIEDCSPNLIELMSALSKNASQVLVKYSPLLDISSLTNAIEHIKELHVVSVKNDCKELLLLINFSSTNDPQIKCVNLESNQSVFSFSMQEEHSASPVYGDYRPFVYESNSSIMKAGAFNQVAEVYDVIKLANNTHLYTSDKMIESFPGRIYRIIDTVNKQSIKTYATNGKINVITRNYPLSPQELKKKWKLRDGGKYYLLAFRDRSNKPQMVIATRFDD